MKRSKRGEDENAGKKDGPKVRAQKTLRDCISVIMWARRPGCGFLINFANFSINARRSFREKGRWEKRGGSDSTTTMASRKEGFASFPVPRHCRLRVRLRLCIRTNTNPSIFNLPSHIRAYARATDYGCRHAKRSVMSEICRAMANKIFIINSIIFCVRLSYANIFTVL